MRAKWFEPLSKKTPSFWECQGDLVVKSNAAKEFSSDFEENRKKISWFIKANGVSLWVVGVDASQIGDYSWYSSSTEMSGTNRGTK
jgi:hypothetical protein